MDHVVPVLHNLSQYPFFRFMRLAAEPRCPFWEDDGLCAMRNCAIDECEDDDVPATLRSASGYPGGGGGDDVDMSPLRYDEAVEDGRLDVTLLPDRFPGEWKETKENRWTDLSGIGGDGDGDDVELIYVDLLRNPERFTAYGGFSAHRIWRSIYHENCFERDDVCYEKRIFYRMISGMQSSIAAHLSEVYLHEDGEWGPNVALYNERLGAHEERIGNLYLLYLMVLRAVTSAAEPLLRYDYSTGNATDDAAVQRLVRDLLGRHDITAACPATFDEQTMFHGLDAAELREDVRGKFYNITRIMSCVGCDKCRLWGTIQVTGIGAALKILFGFDDPQVAVDSLQRVEIIALFQVLTKLSESVDTVRKMRSRYLYMKLLGYTRSVGTVVFVLGIAYLAYVSAKSKRARPKTD